MGFSLDEFFKSVDAAAVANGGGNAKRLVAEVAKSIVASAMRIANLSEHFMDSVEQVEHHQAAKARAQHFHQLREMEAVAREYAVCMADGPERVEYQRREAVLHEMVTAMIDEEIDWYVNEQNNDDGSNSRQPS